LGISLKILLSNIAPIEHAKAELLDILVPLLRQ
jgi:hypothetical protein